MLIGYDPDSALAGDHLARLIDRIVGGTPRPRERSPLGQSAYDPRMLAKLLLFAYATGTFSSRRIEQNCAEHMAYLYLSRGERPCFRTICSARTEYKEYLEQVWLTLLATAASEGMGAAGKIAVDASRFRANASGDLVVESKDYEAMRSRLDEVLARAREVDAREDAEGVAAPTSTGVQASRVTVRRVVRSVGKEAPEGEITPRTEGRLRECLSALDEAAKEKRKHVSLSDPDARMMPIGSQKRISMGHALEVAADSGLLVAGGSTNEASDTGRLVPLVEEARLHDPAPVSGVVADSGYFKEDDVAALQDSGLDVVVPDSTTACKMRRGEPLGEKGEIKFERIEGRHAYRCPAGNILDRIGKPSGDGTAKYRARRECTGCPLAGSCLKDPNAKRRNLRVRAQADRFSSYLAGFADPLVRAAYYARGPAVETVFAFLRRIVGFVQWSVRGSSKVAAEAELLKCTYQVRKLHSVLRTRKRALA